MQLNQNKAEEIYDDSIWLFKSHDTCNFKIPIVATANKVLCCVRNPFDTIASCFIFWLTVSQSMQISNKFNQWPEIWDGFVKAHVENIKKYHDIVLDNRTKQVPHYFIRYEDLYTNPQEILEKVFCFFLELESIEGTNLQRRIKEVVTLGHKATITYAQKTEGVDPKAEIKKIIFNRNID